MWMKKRRVAPSADNPALASGAPGETIMSAVDDPRTFGRTRLSFADPAEVDEFESILGQFERGEISPDQWRAFRLLRGTYGQRQDGVQMIRVKIPQGLLDASQLHALADVAERYSRGFGHITTRQNLQFHFIKLADVPATLDRLAEAGMTTREACGNSIRNITACPYAGVSADELFDVTPYSEALTRYFLRHPLASKLPRKFKIGFEGCPTDHAVTAINDIGWKARVRDNVHGFQVNVAGGTATMVRSGYLLYEFMPVSEMFNVAEAIVRVYHHLGDYEHKHKNRMKFLIKSIGWDRFKEEFDRQLAQVHAEGRRELTFDPEHLPVESAPPDSRPSAPSLAETASRAEQSHVHGPGILPDVKPQLRVLDEDFLRWQHTNVQPQKQAGYALVTATIPLGDFTGAQMRLLADLSLSYADGTVRVTPDQDLVFRWVKTTEVGTLYRQLAALGLGLAEAGTIADVTSCPGAESCRLAVTQSRGLGRLLEAHIRSHPEIITAAPDLKIKMSGCPNGCGQHHIAGIGFQGSIRKLDGRAVPQYFVMVGGAVDEEGATFGRVAAKIPARRMPEVIERLVELYSTSHTGGETATAFFKRIDLGTVKSTLADLERMDAQGATADDFIDLGETTTFTPEVMDGECAT
jgi:sulfite reductase beta subunit-like hemoprotein